LLVTFILLFFNTNVLQIESAVMELSAVLTPAPEGGYIAYNPETGTTTQGEPLEEALANLQEATELYLEEFPYCSGAVHFY
jgi:predicted RNase H-like HicB family nuclease